MMLLKRPKDTSAIYMCPVCCTCYTTKEEADKCAVSTPAPELKVGDIVKIAHGYGRAWLNGPHNKDWIDPQPGYNFHGEPTLQFLFVVVGVSGYKGSEYAFMNHTHCHRNCYHVYTEAVKNGKPFKNLPQGVGGWTTREGHKGWEKPSRIPKSVRERAAQIVSTGPHYGELL